MQQSMLLPTAIDNEKNTMIKIESPVSGRVVAILAQVGDTLNPGDAVLTVESMKMEIPVEAERSGTLSDISVQVDDEVTEGQHIATQS